jgi:hypothetical protein
MSAAERAHLDLLLSQPLDWSRVVGERSMAILTSGSKVELEGATNPAIYGDALTRELSRELFDRARPASRRGAD